MPADVGDNVHGSKVNRQGEQILLVAKLGKRGRSNKPSPFTYSFETGVVNNEGQKVDKDLARHDNLKASIACQLGPSIARNNEGLEHNGIT